MKINQDVYFWVELKWVYTFSDIVKCYENEFDKNWCYTKPDEIA